MDLRKRFIELLTSDNDCGTRIFNEDGTPSWCEVTLDMIMDKFDKAIKGEAVNE